MDDMQRAISSSVRLHLSANAVMLRCVRLRHTLLNAFLLTVCLEYLIHKLSPPSEWNSFTNFPVSLSTFLIQAILFFVVSAFVHCRVITPAPQYHPP